MSEISSIFLITFGILSDSPAKVDFHNNAPEERAYPGL